MEMKTTEILAYLTFFRFKPTGQPFLVEVDNKTRDKLKAAMNANDCKYFQM